MSEALQQQFLEVIDRDEAERRFRAALDLRPLEAETVPLTEALGRVLAADVVAALDVPSFDRSNVDGFAVQAADTFGASEDRPRTLRLKAETLATGIEPREGVRPGTATAIATGAMLPRGADAVVMIEHTDLRKDEGGRMKDESRQKDDSPFILHPSSFILVSRPVAPGANLTFAGTDIGQGEVVLRRGERLTSRETGVIAALGLDRVSVVRRPRVAILSTGDELLPPGAPMRPGMVHDSNSTVLADAVRELGGEPVPLGIEPDDDRRLDEALAGALAHDAILLSGGTSKGAGDLSYRAVARLGKPGIVAHGVALKPGKPLCLAVVHPPGRRPVPVAVLPGFPTSAIFTFHEFVAPVLRCLAGQRVQATATVPARLPMRVSSERGRTEYLLVGLVQAAEISDPIRPIGPIRPMESPTPELVAYPMGKGSGSVTAFSRADGFIIIPRQREYVERDSIAQVHLLAAEVLPADLVVIGSHCTGLDYLLGLLQERGLTSKVMAVGSTGGLEAAKRGECDLAGVHLLDPATDNYNRPFLTDALDLIPGYGRIQGIVFRKGDQRFEGKTPVQAVACALADPECVLVNRNRGSGTRLLIDQLLGEARPAGYLAEPRSHNAVAAAVVQGRADWGVAIETVARSAGLGFLPLRVEQYDFIVPRARRKRPAVEAFVALLAETSTRNGLAEMGFTTSPRGESSR
jgi:putative molybdopterin biosynthesis protein